MLVLLGDAVSATCGGKAGALGALLRAGLPVPDGFVLPFATYRAAAGGSTLPADVREALARALGAGPVAVRSSADVEDTAGASAAGQHESVLAVQGIDQVADAVLVCWASLHSPRAVAYRDGGGEPSMGVLVQRHLDADVSGVMFTAGDTQIEASWGLGPSVVGGTVTPDAYRVAADGTVTRTVADKRTRLDRRGTRLVTSDVPEHDRRRATLDDATAVRLAALGQTVADLLGGPQDVEWAVVDGDLWVLQARPTTADLPERLAQPVHDVSTATLVGTPCSPGTATGTARIVRGPGDFGRVRPGDILVCPWTDPSWTPLLRVAAGVVTETGGVLSHAAIVARERRIPAVLGIADATTTLHDATTLTIDGTAGTVTTHR
ncbi:PEP/pyruvate-binding domain-containing protein [Cellulomonas sp. P5_C5]